jgi:uncharacterized protein DUF4242
MIKVTKEDAMPKFLIEREIPGAGSLSQQALQNISQTSCSVLQKMGPQIQWLQSYVTGDKIYCVYIAPNEEMIREHAKQGGFPANRVSEITSVIDPTTAEQQSADSNQQAATG